MSISESPTIRKFDTADRRIAEPQKHSAIVSDHPLMQHHLAALRDVATDSAEFRRLINRLATLLAYEATRDLELRPRSVRTPLTEMTGRTLSQRVGLVPILRAGLGMVDAVLELLPAAEVWHLGVYRDETTMSPVEYYSRLPVDRPVDVAMILDPMLATGGSAVAALSSLREWGVAQVKVLSIIASRDGIAMVQAQFPEAQLYVCAVDDELNSQKYIVPGLGDAGDRIFNTGA